MGANGNGNGARLTPEEQYTLQQVVKRLRFKQVSCSRTLKTKGGDFFINHTVTWDDGEHPLGAREEETVAVEDVKPDTKGARLATAIVGMMVEEQAYLNARDGGAISQSHADSKIRSTKGMYLRRMAEILRTK